MGIRHWLFFLVSIITPLAPLSLPKRFGQFFATNFLNTQQVNGIFSPYLMPKFALTSPITGTSPWQVANRDKAHRQPTLNEQYLQYFKLPSGISRLNPLEDDDRAGNDRGNEDNIAQYEKNRKILSRVFIIWLAVSLVLLLNAVNVIEIF